MSHILPLQLPITKFNKKTERLILGYVRGIEIVHWIIPSAIIELCIMYYHSKFIVICFAETIKITHLDANKHYDTIITPLNQSVDAMKFINGPPMDTSPDAAFRVCYVEDFSLPSSVLKQNKALDANNVYSVIFQISDPAYYSYGSANADAYIVDANADEKYRIYEDEYIDIYHWQIPKAPKCSFLYPVYSAKHGLIVIGKQFHRLQFDDSRDPFWEKMSGKYTERDDGAAAFIDEDRFIFCGGGEGYDYNRKCEMYDFNTCNWTSLKDMNCDRHKAGICFDDLNDNVFVGGGTNNTSSSLKFECLDLKQNKWISYRHSNKRHRYYPIIWTDDRHLQVVHIASSSSQVFERMDLRENKWNIYIDQEKYQNMFAKHSKLHSKLCM